MVACNGDFIQLLQHPSADRGCTDLLGRVVQLEEGEKFLEISTAGDTVAVVIKLFKFFDYLVVFIPNLADQLLKDILEGDDADSAAVFIRNDREV